MRENPAGTGVTTSAREPLTGDDVGEVVAGLDVAQDVGVGEAEVGIEQDDAAAHCGQDGCQIDGEISLADAAFAGSDGNRLSAGRRTAGDFAEGGGLIHDSHVRSLCFA